MFENNVDYLNELPCAEVLRCLEKKEITLSAYRVWIRLKSLAVKGLGCLASLSYRELASLLDISSKTAMRAIKQLCSLNLLTKRMSRTEKCYFEPNAYEISSDLIKNSSNPQEPRVPATATGDIKPHITSPDGLKSNMTHPTEPGANLVEDERTQELREEILKLETVRDEATALYALYQQKNIEEPTVYAHLQALGAAEVLRDRANNEIVFLQKDLALVDSLSQASRQKKEIATALNNPSYFNELPGDRKLSDSQFKTLYRVLENFNQDSAIAVNSVVYMIRFGTLVKGKFGGTNTVERALGIAMKLVREKRYVPLTEEYLQKFIEKN